MYNGVVEMTTQHALAQFVQEWLGERKATQLWLAKQAGIPHSTLSALFTRNILPRPETLKRLAQAMGVPVGRLLVLAGYITPQEYETPIKETELARLYEVGDLTDDEWEQVRDFARYVRSRRR